MMQIRELVLYGYSGKVRHLHFRLGQVNIITGRSKSGKSVVGDIIDYCLGGAHCNIADGVVRENVEWYGLLLQFDSERVFVARKNPDKGQNSCTSCYIDIGNNIESPQNINFKSNTNVSGIEQELSRRLGISENSNRPSEGHTRSALEANIRHALYYCFQGQDEIAAKTFLFHRQSEDFITQSIKDTLPYFLGAVGDHDLFWVGERKRLQREFVLKKRKIEENQSIEGCYRDRAMSLISEAQQVGIIARSTNIDYKNYHEMYECLSSIVNWTPDMKVENGEIEGLTFLQNKLHKMIDELNDLDVRIDSAEHFIDESSGYYDEAKHQKKCLESIGLFEQLDFDPEKCPFCSGKLEFPLPSIDMLKASIVNLDQSIMNVTRENPRIETFISELKDKRNIMREEIKQLEAQIDGWYQQEQERTLLKDLNVQRGKVVGRISLWLESINNNLESLTQEQDLKSLEERIQEIERVLDIDSIDERKQSALSQIQENMTRWASSLKLEHSGSPYRLDLNKVTVVVDTLSRPIPLRQLGSGSNWVGIHLITYFALQSYFINAKRPVPSFLFLDQPSQVYFPTELDTRQIDKNAVDAIYKFIIDRTNELNGKLQVIVVDHASLINESFRSLICENWWLDDQNLVPTDWYKT